MTNFATEREIRQQPQVWRDFAPALTEQADALRAWIAARDHDQVWFCGAGTSAFIGESLAVTLNAGPGSARFRAVPSTDLVGTPQNYVRDGLRVLVVSFGRSGNSSESVGSLDLLDTHAPGYDRLHITCNASSVLATRAMPDGAAGQFRALILPPETEDAGFAMTSSYTTMYLSALSVFAPPADGVVAQWGRVADAAESIIAQGFAQTPDLPGRAVFLGAGALAGAARECALKVLELTAGQVVTMFDTPLGFRHGPKAVVNDTTRIFVLGSAYPQTARYEADLIDELGRQYQDGIATRLVPSGGLDDAWSVPLHVIPAQILALQWAQALGLNADDPFAGRNLTRVVSGVTLYPFDRGAA
ncbi:MAG: SIS domain-containing protein [Paracoccus sp. (in: a-proteobacteria)]|uniref:SIS domain-containing protein n=1 Tax=Paracoccus sp. TaxID=267 RepID=UPI0026E0DD93|nr:SIS domain-containing protein [Paracoccus sp. (in: a-proteobacteria)]MDO5630879.1 SIS domain-containing protein [Paracoccus sp. (in: a-proteobacteria)]